MIADVLKSGSFAVIGGSGFDRYPELNLEDTNVYETPYGIAAPLLRGSVLRKRVVFMPRHGIGHAFPPHKINYRANLWALKSAGVKAVLAVNAVGGIRDDLAPGRLVIPDQIIDYTYGREHTLYENEETGVEHVDVTSPFDLSWRDLICHHLQHSDLPLSFGGVYGCTQGPRLETAAEIIRLRRDGCDMVGMTAMPEAGLAKELGLPYASLSVVVNWAAGIGDGIITIDEIKSQLEKSIDDVKAFLRLLVTGLS